MPSILLPPFGGDKRGGFVLYPCFCTAKYQKRGEVAHAPHMEVINNLFVQYHQRKL